jgi:adenylosuccinate synthase
VEPKPRACTPHYVEVEGWGANTQRSKRGQDLLAGARRYLELLEAQVGVPIRMVSVGPDRHSTFRI